MTRLATLIVAAAAIATAGSAFAQGAAGAGAGRGAKLQERFAAADTNGDGRLSRDEAKAGMPMVYKHFDEIDKAKTGSVSMQDIAAYVKERRAAKSGS